MADALPPRLDPKTIEGPLYRSWSEAGYFHVEPGPVMSGSQEPYVVVIPPPNVTAVLHMGHGLNNTIQDVMIRWRRMQGRVSLWVPGTDHAGIATQNVVERRLADEGTTRLELGREAFVERVWEHVNGTGGRILEQLKVIGSSCDFERTRFTLDEGLNRAVREVFVRLYEKDLIYRGKYIINWCPRCLTARSNEEAEAEDAERRTGQGPHIVRGDFIEHGLEQTRQHYRTDQPRDTAAAYGPPGLPDDPALKTRRVGAQCHAYTDLSGSPSHGLSDHARHTGSGQSERQDGEHAEQHGIEARRAQVPVGYILEIQDLHDGRGWLGRIDRALEEFSDLRPGRV